MSAVTVARTEGPVALRSVWVITAGAATATAGVLHAVAAVDHLDAGPWVSPFFVGCAAAQLAAGGWLLATRRPAPRVLGAILAGTVGLVVLYLVVHGTHLLDAVAGHGGLDHDGHDAEHLHGHDPGAGATADPAADGFAAGHAIASEGPVPMGGSAVEPPEAPEVLGSLTVAVQLLAVSALTALLPARLRSRAANTVLLLGISAVLLWLTGLLF